MGDGADRVSVRSFGERKHAGPEEPRPKNGMEHFVIEKSNGREIPCISEIPSGAARIVLIVHGLGASKESDSSRFYMGAFRQRGLGVLAYDQPAHGEEAAASEAFRIGNCLESLDAVDRYLHARYPEAEVCYFGSSFGAYITALWVQQDPQTFRKAFFRSGALFFPQKVLQGMPTDAEEYAEGMRRGYFEVSLGTEELAHFTTEFLADMRDPANDVGKRYAEQKPAGLRAMFVNGEKDPVVSPERIADFARQHGYPMTIFPNEGHSINSLPGDPEKIANLAMRFFAESSETGESGTFAGVS